MSKQMMIVLVVIAALSVSSAVVLMSDSDDVQAITPEEGMKYYSETTGLQYASFTDAADATDPGQTMTMLADDTLVPCNIGKGITIDLAGHTLNLTNDDSEANVIMAFTGGESKITSSAAGGKIVSASSQDNNTYGWFGIFAAGVDTELTIENVTVSSYVPKVDEYNYSVTVRDGATLELGPNVTINEIEQTSDTPGQTIGVLVYGDNSGNDTTFVMNGATISTSGFGISGNGELHNTQMDLISGSVTSSKSQGIYHPQDGVINVREGMTIKGVSGIEIRSGVLNVYGGTIEGTGKSFTSSSNAGGSTTSGAGIAVCQHTTDLKIDVNVYDGTISGLYGLYQDSVEPDNEPEKVNLNIVGGDFQKKEGSSYSSVYSEDKTGFIMGGSFDEDPTMSDYLVDNYEYDSTSGSVKVDPDVTTVAEIDGTGYPTLQDAVNAATDGQTVVITAETVNEDIQVNGGKNIILDLNGKTLQSSTGSNTHTIVVNEDAKLTINATNGGTVDCTVNGKAIIYNDEGTVVINGGTFIRSNEKISETYPTSGHHTWYLIFNVGNLEINDGTFIGGYPESDGTYYLGNVSSVVINGQSNENVQNPGTLTINNGNFLGAAVIIKNDLGTLDIINGTFTMDNTEHAWVGGNNIILNYGEMDITGGTYEAKGSGLSIDKDTSSYRFGIFNEGSANVSGITLTMAGNYNIGLNQSNDATGDFNISDSEVTILDTDEPTNRAVNVPANGNGKKMTISSGTYQGFIGAVEGNLVIENGTFKDSGDISNHLAPGLTLETDADGNSIVTEAPEYSVSISADKTAILEGDTATITVTESGKDPEASLTYTWTPTITYDGGSSVQVTPTATTTYSLKVTGTNYGETVDFTSNEITITVTEAVVLTFVENGEESFTRTIAKGTSLGEYPAFTQTPPTGFEYYWMYESDNGTDYWTSSTVMDADTTITATQFVTVDVTISISTSGNYVTLIAEYGIEADVEVTDVAYQWFYEGNPVESYGSSITVDGDGLYTVYVMVTTGTYMGSGYAELDYAAPASPDNPSLNPGWDDDDDYVPLPPQIVYEDQSSDDETVKIVACAAAAVVAALIAAFLILSYRKD